MSADPAALAAKIGDAARHVGFFYVTGHRIDPSLIDAVFAASSQFFALPAEGMRVGIDGRKGPRLGLRGNFGHEGGR
jgi:isopenicillin N synthase-like dioxygenase